MAMIYRQLNIDVVSNTSTVLPDFEQKSRNEILESFTEEKTFFNLYDQNIGLSEKKASSNQGLATYKKYFENLTIFNEINRGLNDFCGKYSHFGGYFRPKWHLTAGNRLAKFAPTEEPAEKGCNKGTAVIVIISLVAIIGITLGISLSVGKKDKKEVKKSKK